MMHGAAQPGLHSKQEPPWPMAQAGSCVHCSMSSCSHLVQCLHQPLLLPLRLIKGLPRCVAGEGNVGHHTRQLHSVVQVGEGGGLCYWRERCGTYGWNTQDIWGLRHDVHINVFTWGKASLPFNQSE
jgi:hypothetical protein